MSFWPFSQILTHRHTKGIHFIFQKWYCFWKISFDQKDLIQNSFWAHNSNNTKTRSLLGSKIDWKRSLGSTDDCMSFATVFDFTPHFLIYGIIQRRAVVNSFGGSQNILIIISSSSRQSARPGFRPRSFYGGQRGPPPDSGRPRFDGPGRNV